MEKLYIDLVTMAKTVKGNRYLLTVEDGFSRYVCAYPLPNKEALTLAWALAHEHFPRYGLAKQENVLRSRTRVCECNMDRSMQDIANNPDCHTTVQS